MSGQNSLGRFVWSELLTTDVEGAIKFYGETIGWETEAWQGGEKDYTMWVSKAGPIGGVMTLPQKAVEMGAPPHWLAHVSSPDVDATADQAKGLGASLLHGPEDVPDAGRFAVLADPQGAVFSIFTAVGEDPPKQESDGLGEVSWHELATTDQEAAFGFYEALFGWEKTDAMDMGEMGIYQMYGLGGTTLGGMFTKSEQMPGPPAWLLYVSVADVHATAEKIKEKGGTILNGPMEVPGGGWIAQCLDPQGAAIAIHADKKA